MSETFRLGYDSNGHEYNAAAILPPEGRPGYAHSSECRQRDRDPAWEMADLATRTWKRGPCSGAASCSLVQYFDPRSLVPAPPRPDDEALAEFLRHHGEDHVQVALDTLDGDLMGHWSARCEHCRQVHRWRHEAAEWYRQHGAEVAPRMVPFGSATLHQLVGS
jgi:hypothetical protein